MTDQTNPTQDQAPQQGADAPQGPQETKIGTLRQVPVGVPGGGFESRWGIVTGSRVYSVEQVNTAPDGSQSVSTVQGVQDTVELLSGSSVIVEH